MKMCSYRFLWVVMFCFVQNAWSEQMECQYSLQPMAYKLAKDFDTTDDVLAHLHIELRDISQQMYLGFPLFRFPPKWKDEKEMAVNDLQQWVDVGNDQLLQLDPVEGVYPIDEFAVLYANADQQDQHWTFGNKLRSKIEVSVHDQVAIVEKVAIEVMLADIQWKKSNSEQAQVFISDEQEIPVNDHFSLRWIMRKECS
ncbi:MAG: hypothetical protein R3A45_01955 [Bdellovibrionota bacterium]